MLLIRRLTPNGETRVRPRATEQRTTRRVGGRSDNLSKVFKQMRHNKCDRFIFQPICAVNELVAFAYFFGSIQLLRT